MALLLQLDKILFHQAVGKSMDKINNKFLSKIMTKMNLIMSNTMMKMIRKIFFHSKKSRFQSSNLSKTQDNRDFRMPLQLA